MKAIQISALIYFFNRDIWRELERKVTFYESGKLKKKKSVIAGRRNWG